MGKCWRGAPPWYIQPVPTPVVEEPVPVTVSGTTTGGSVGFGNPTSGALSYTPTVGISMAAAGGLEVFVPDDYEVGTFAHRTSTGSCTTTPGVPAAATTFYQPCFANASGVVEGHPATSVFDAFDVPLMLLQEGNPNSGTGCDRWDKFYTTIQSVSEDDAYIMHITTGNSIEIHHFTGGSVGTRVAGTPACSSGISASNSALRWMLGPHKHKIFYQNGNDVRVYNVDTNRWCTALSADGLSDTCASVAATAYHSAPWSGWGIGGNQGDMVSGNYVPITRTSPNPAEVFVYDVVAKTSVQLTSVPTGTLDYCELSQDGAKAFCRIAGANYAWNATTGAILNGGVAVGGGGHAAFSLLPDGTPIQICARDGTPAADAGSCNNASFGPQRKAYHPFDSSTFTNFFQLPSPRDPQTTCENSHFSGHQSFPDPAHYLVAFMHESSATATDQADVTAGALGANWDNDWRAHSREIQVCDFGNVSGAIDTAPNCWRLAHTYTFDDNRDCASCPTLTRSGKYVVYRSHLSTDITSSTLERTYIIRLGPLF